MLLPSSPISFPRITRSKSKVLGDLDSAGKVTECEKSMLWRDPGSRGSGEEKGKSLELVLALPVLTPRIAGLWRWKKEEMVFSSSPNSCSRASCPKFTVFELDSAGKIMEGGKSTLRRSSRLTGSGKVEGKFLEHVPAPPACTPLMDGLSQTGRCYRSQKQRLKKDEMVFSSPISFSRVTRSKSKLCELASAGKVLECKKSTLQTSSRFMGSGKKKGKCLQPLRRSPRLSLLKLDSRDDNPMTHQGNLAACEVVSKTFDSLKVIQRNCSRKKQKVCSRRDKNGGISTVANNGHEELGGESGTSRVKSGSVNRFSNLSAQFRNAEFGSGLANNICQSVEKVGLSTNASQKLERKVNNKQFKRCKFTGDSEKHNSEATRQTGECRNYKERLRNSAEVDRKKEELTDKENADFGIREMANCWNKTGYLNEQRREGMNKRKREGNDGKSSATPAIKQCKSGYLPCGWTKEQEAALWESYFSAKPTPNFWKKIAKMVPGKTSQECFNRVYHKLPTPQQRRPRYKKGIEDDSSNTLLSDSKLLEPLNLNIKRVRKKEQKNRIAQKTVRHLLSKHQLANQGYEPDLFSVLEDHNHTTSPILLTKNLFSTPGTMHKSFMFLQKCQESSSCDKDLISPPVLKKVKNMALHEKFIDKLHGREARSKRTFNQARNASSSIGGNKENEMPKVDVKAAKNALVSDATDFIRHYKKVQKFCILEDEAEGDENELEEEY